jgi:type IV pilus assembly protein PilA
MVVVAIIGILAAIAVPNFQRFTAKSKQSEVKGNLSAVYSANRAFAAEWQTFTSIFETMGYLPNGNFRYEHGFSGANFPAAFPTGYTGPAAGSINTAAFCAAPPPGVTCAVNQSPIPPGAVATPAMTSTTFTAQGQGDIDGDAGIDTWRIDQAKNITNTVDDLSI